MYPIGGSKVTDIVLPPPVDTPVDTCTVDPHRIVSSSDLIVMAAGDTPGVLDVSATSFTGGDVDGEAIKEMHL